MRRRAGLLATLALGTMPLFVLEARQLTSDAPLIAGLALALGGLGRYAWPADGRRRWLDLGAGLAGVAIGALAGGALSGLVLPILSMALALLIGRGLVVEDSAAIQDGTAALAAPGIGPDVVAGGTLGASTFRPGRRGFVPLVLLVLAAAALGLAAVGRLMAGKYSWLLGGVTRVRPADAHLRNADPRAGIRPVPLERRRLLRAGPPAHAAR